MKVKGIIHMFRIVYEVETFRVFSNAEGYYQYRRGILSERWVDTFRTVEGIQHRGLISSVMWSNTISTQRHIMSRAKGYQ